MLKPLLALTLSLVSATTLSAAEWREVNFGEGKFRVEFPDKPESFSQNVESDLGKLTVHFHYVEVDGGKLVYMATHTDYPPDKLNAKTRNLVLDQVTSGENFERVLESKPVEKITLGKQEGRTFEFKSVQQGNDQEGKVLFVAGRVFLVENQVIQIFVAKPADWPSKAERERFFNSLKLQDD
jgi:hypothetical protein